MGFSRDASRAIATVRPRRVVMACEWHLKYATPLARGFAEIGCQVRFVTRTHDLEFGGDAGSARPGGMMRWVTETLDGRAEHLALPGRVRDVSAVPEVFRLRRAIRHFAPEMTLLQDSVVHDLRLALIAGARPRRYALTVHNAESHPGDPRRSARVQRSYSMLIRNAGLLFVHTESIRDRLIELEHPPAPVVVVPHGVSPPRFHPLPATPTLLLFGRVSRYKGVETLLEAMPRVWERVPAARLTIAGVGPIEDRAALADSRVTVRNEHVAEEDVEGLFAAARCVVLPYLEASQSGVGAQAKQFGRPLVVTDVGGLPDLVADGAGRVVPAGEEGALADALVDVLTTPGLGERMAERAVQFVAHAGWDRVAQLSLEAYERHLRP
jgi:glycosyltransferase involved in cell wall biosynthesis